MPLFRAAIAVLLVLALAGCSPSASVLNLLVSREGYSIHENLAYGSDPRQKLDVYKPDRLTAKAPVILFFYGGSWQNGRKGDYLAFGESFATKGIVVAIADYRVYPQVRYPDFLKDGAAAFAYVHAHIAEYGGDPNRIFLAGHSAGAYIAVMLAANPHYLEDAGEKLSAVRGVIGIAGPYDFLPLTDPILIKIFGGAHRTDMLPITYLDGKRPPMLLTTGDADKTVSPGNTKRFAAKLRSFDSPVKEIVYPGISHVGIILSLAPMLRGNTTLRQDMIDFVNSN
jgi:acetyl esterase/lipase